MLLSMSLVNTQFNYEEEKGPWWDKVSFHFIMIMNMDIKIK